MGKSYSEYCGKVSGASRDVKTEACIVQDYYGKVFTTSKGLKTNACIVQDNYGKVLQEHYGENVKKPAKT
jgi:extradiol dioxygenase family protein